MSGANLVRRGLDGLAALRSQRGFDASDAETGLYPALYGRDSLWVLLLLLEAAALGGDERVAALMEDAGPVVLTSLAQLQGTTTNDLIEEQPGRIPHEYHPVPTPHAEAMGLPLVGGRSYGGFDETFLFAVAYDEFIRAHKGHPVADEVWPHVQRALAWIDEYADPDGDGLFEYGRRHPANLLNQVWKDSFDSATHTGFDVPPQPLAWLDVQAYAYAVFKRYDSNRAEALARRVDERFWLGPDEGYAIALDGEKRPIRMVASNPGHALWAGIVMPERVHPLVTRMTQSDLLTVYGLRTLSSESPYYAPFAYHRGAVWPFDNAVFALGLLHQDQMKHAVRVATAVGAALTQAGSPAECYAVLDPEHLINPSSDRPLLCWRHYPVHNRVQAFSAAALVVFGTILDLSS